MPPSPNRLSQATSPYLRAHAENPVDWYPWSDEALSVAERLDKPILQSVGYSACHWCHVMERESFENEAIAKLMNEHFVCIKVDREERPDIDNVYMAVTVALNGNGGWPMTVFLTPERTPFFAGTYFPPDDRYGRPGFRTLLLRIAELWEADRDALFRQAAEITDHVQSTTESALPREVEAESIELAVEHLKQAFDERYGGFGSAPKFPPCAALRLLMRHLQRTDDDSCRQIIRRTLDGMKNGGLFDQLGGGFARYSTDERWLVPHFEKMLYDNAELARVYLEAYQLLGDPEYKRVARQTLDYVISELSLPEGGYASSADADSEGEEGKFFVFSKREIEALLDADDARVFCAYFDVSEEGNWEGKNVLWTPREKSEVRSELGLDETAFDAALQRGKERVLAARKRRVAPAIDDKVLASWNGLMLGAMAEGYRVLGDKRYLQSAEGAANFLASTLQQEDGRLYRTARQGVRHIDGYLDDYAYTADGLLALYEASADDRWFRLSESLARLALTDFRDAESGAFFQTSERHEALIIRLRDGQDGALPNPNAVLSSVLLRLSRHLDDPELAHAAEQAIRAYGSAITQLPRAYLSALLAVDESLEPAVEVVFSKDHERRLARAVATRFLPRRVIAHVPEAENSTPRSRLASDKLGTANASVCYVCHHFKCEAPARTEEEVLRALDKVSAAARADRKSELRTRAVSGKATREGTLRYFERMKSPESAFGPLGRTGLFVSRLGFGGYQVSRQSKEHRAAFELALSSGCNLFDSAPSYMGGESEALFGSGIEAQIRNHKLGRDEIVAMTKLGLVSASSAQREGTGLVEINEQLAYAIAPEDLERELNASLKRLGLTCIDIVLLHDPELLLEVMPRDEVLSALTRAFSWFEQRVARGEIQWFGVSTTGLDTLPGGKRFRLKELNDAATRAEARHFSVLQLPVNPLERAGFGDDSEPGAVAEAEAAGLAAIVHRPLTSVANGQLLRLIEAPAGPGASDLESARALLSNLEAEFRSRLGKVLNAAPGIELKTDELFRWSERFPPVDSVDRERWNAFERQVLAPELPRVLSAMNRAFHGNRLEPIWRDFQKRYTQALEACIVACRERSFRNTNQRNRPALEAFQRLASEAVRDGSLSQHVLWNVRSLPGVYCTLVGMRSQSHVRSALSTLHWPDAADPRAALTSAGTALTR